MLRSCAVSIAVIAIWSCGLFLVTPALAQQCPRRESADKFVGGEHQVEFRPSTRYETLTFVSENGLPIEPRADQIAEVRDKVIQAKLGVVLEASMMRHFGSIVVRLAPGVTADQLQHVAGPTLVAGKDAKGLGNPVFDAGDVDHILVNQIIVQFYSSAKEEFIRSLLARYCAHMVDRPDGRVGQRYLLTFDDQTARHALAMVNRLNNEKFVEYAQPDIVVVATDKAMSGLTAGPGNACPPPTTAGIDPYFPQQWFLDHSASGPGLANADINAPEAWVAANGANILVAVLDGAVETTHEDLQGKIAGTWNAYTNNTDLLIVDADKHGTPVAGIVGAVTGNPLGVKGTAPEVRLMPVRVVDWEPDGDELHTYSAVVNGIEHAVAANAHIISMSLSLGEYDLDSCDTRNVCQGAVRTAVANAIAAGIVPVFAAGNDNLSTLVFPAYLAATMPVIAVGATDASDVLKKKTVPGDWGSNRGEDLSVVAPGVSVVTTDRTGSQGYCATNYVGFAGTSAATPVVAGVAAVVQSQFLAQGQPLLTPQELKARLETTAKDLGATGDDLDYGNGRVDACKALQAGTCSIPLPPHGLTVDNGGGFPTWLIYSLAILGVGMIAWWVKRIAAKNKPSG